jgi:hypothetical protein
MITDTFLTELLKLVLSAVATILTAAIVPWIIARLKSAQSVVGERTWMAILEAATIAVQAAEQSGLAGLIVNAGQEKKRYAIEAMQNLLTARGIHLDVGAIESAIEAAVLTQIKSTPVEETLKLGG